MPVLIFLLSSNYVVGVHGAAYIVANSQERVPLSSMLTLFFIISTLISDDFRLPTYFCEMSYYLATKTIYIFLY